MDDWFDQLGLEPEQEDVLSAMVEAERKIPRSKRSPFILSQAMGGESHLIHVGLEGRQLSASRGDLETLAERGLLRASFSSRGTPLFDVTPEGRRYYEYMKVRSGKPVEQAVKEVRSYLDADAFREAYPEAYQLWTEAENGLWGADTLAQFTSIGHKCREAMQNFAAALVLNNPPSVVDPNPAHTVARVRAVVTEALPSSKLRDFVDALITYWGVTSDLVQRQEHGGQKEGQPLDWEDTRRVVFHTVIVMFEIARAVSQR
jgi:hypothetical protein